MKKASSFLALLASPLLAAPAISSSELDFSLAADVVGIEYRLLDVQRGSQWGGGLIYNDDEGATLVSAQFSVVGEPGGVEDLYTGVGLKAIVHNTFQTAATLALGGSIRYEPEHFQGIGLEGRLYYAPDVLNTNDAEQYFELVARVTYAVHEQARVFVGLSDITVRYDDLEVDRIDIQRGFNLGFTMMF